MFRYVCIVICLVAMTSVAYCHRGDLDADGGHFDKDKGLYHFQNEDGTYEPNVEEKPANHFVGPWIYTVAPAFNGVSSGDWRNAGEDALDAYTEGDLTETTIAAQGSELGTQKGNGWRLDWEVGFLKEVNPVCEHNIPEIAGHLLGATLQGSSYFYGVFMFTADRAAKATLHLEYMQTARVWLNGTEVYRSTGDWWEPIVAPEEEDPSPWLPQVMIRKGNNLLFVKVGRGGNNCGNAPEWFLWCGLKPHTPTRLEVPLIYEDGAVIVDYVTSWAKIKAQ